MTQIYSNFRPATECSFIIHHSLKKYCRNCYYPLPYKAKFCANCGQKDSDGKVPVSDVMQQLWFRILHLESRSWRVLWRLFIPGQVSLDYFKGKRKRYPPPVQFFFVIMFFFLFTLSHLMGDGGFYVRKTPKGYQIDYGADKSRTTDLYKAGQRYWQRRVLYNTLDSLPPEYRTEQVRAAVDSLLRLTSDTVIAKFESVFEAKNDSVSTRLDTFTLGFNYRSIRIATKDMFLLEPAEIIRNYGYTHWFDKIIVQQTIKSLKDPAALVKTFIGSLAWTLLVQVALMAGVLTLLYWRQKRYYVEHFIFLLHEHSSAFLLLTIAILVQQIGNLPPLAWIALVTWLTIASFISMRRYYRQGRVMTFAKWTLFSIIYVTGFAVLFLIVVLLAFLIF